VIRVHPSVRAASVAAAFVIALPARGAAQQHQHQPAQPQQPDPHAAHAGHQAAPAQPAAAAPARPDSGVTVLRAEFSFGPVGAAERRAPREKEEMEVRLRLTDPVTGRPATGLNPTAWIDVRREEGATTLEQCRQKVATFTEAGLHVKHGQISIATPVEDLNGHYVLAMARQPAIAVLDPVKGFGRTKLFTAIPLPSPGEDWAATPDDRRVFVSSPDSGALSIVDTHSFRVTKTLRLPHPTVVRIDPAGRYVWVSTQEGAAWGMAVVDALAGTVVQRLPAGAGPHALAFSDDGAYAFVANRAAGTLSVFDARSLRPIGEAEVGQQPVDVAWSAVRSAAYVVNEGDGTVAVVDPARKAVVERVTFKPGIRSLRFAPEPMNPAGHAGHDMGPARGGRLAFVLNPREGVMQILDVVDRRIVRTLSGAPEPDQVAFTGSFAYVRAAGTASVALIPLANPTGGAVGPHDYFPAGSNAPGAIAGDHLGDVIISQPGMHDAIYAANPKERMIYSYHYMEGMPVPHGGLTTYSFEPRAIRTISRHVREVEPGVYAATLRMDRAGEYDLVLRNPDPYVLGCYSFTVQPDPSLNTGHSVRVEAVAEGGRALKVGRNALRFRVTDTRAGAALEGLTDLRVQLASTSGWQMRADAKAVGGGVYEVEFDIPEAGVYYAAFEIPSHNLGLRDHSPISFQAQP
jgi:DNA-binding beta-propeller fold protein YncE